MPNVSPLDPANFRALADALGESPETAIAVCLLRRNRCRAYVAGDPARFDAALIQALSCPEEPIAFGKDVEALARLLQAAQGWTCVLTDNDCARPLGVWLERTYRKPVRYLMDCYHVLETPVAAFDCAEVRLLAPNDTPLLEAAPRELRDSALGSVRDLLRDGFAACAIVDGYVVATALTAAVTDRYADLGVFTAKPFRRRGFSTAAAFLVARAVQVAGRIPLWSTSEQNASSLRLASKLGFKEMSRRTYAILCP